MEVCVMENLGAVICLSRGENASSPFFQDILFEPAARWLCAALQAEGTERFFVVCDEADRDAAAACFPANTEFAYSDANDVPARLAAFLSLVPGPVAVVTQPVLLAPEGTSFGLSQKEQPKGVVTLRGAALAAALQDGRDLMDTVAALGDAKPFQDRALPLKDDLAYRASAVEPLAKHLSVERLLANRVRFVDADHTYVGPAVTVGEGSTLLPGTILLGETAIGVGCVIGPNSMLTDCTVGDKVTINASQLVESTVEDECTVGPFAYVRPGCHIAKKVKVGDFVELKNSRIGEGTKISHLTYVGDSDVGAGVNFGCGTVTVNYDGKHKFRTVIGDHAFIGCNTNLVAPVTVGEGAFTAAGSTITDEVPADDLAIARARQVNKKGWAKRRRGE